MIEFREIQCAIPSMLKMTQEAIDELHKNLSEIFIVEFGKEWMDLVSATIRDSFCA